MNVKFSENVVLTISTMAEISHITAYPERKLKVAERFVQASPPTRRMMILKNSGFQLTWKDVISKCWGATYRFKIYHPEFSKDPDWAPENRELIVEGDQFCMQSLISSRTIVEGEIIGSFSFHLEGSGSSRDTYRFISDSDPLIPEAIENYKEFYDNKVTTVLEPGRIYVNRDGRYFLSLRNDLYSYVAGTGNFNWSSGPYSMESNYGCRHFSKPEKVGLMLYLGDERPKNLEINSFPEMFDHIKNHYPETWGRRSGSILRVKSSQSRCLVKIDHPLVGVQNFIPKLDWEDLRKNFILEFSKYTDDHKLGALTFLFCMSPDPKKITVNPDFRKEVRSIFTKSIISRKSSKYALSTLPEFREPIPGSTISDERAESIALEIFKEVRFLGYMIKNRGVSWLYENEIYKDVNDLKKELDDIRFSV